MRPDDPSAEIGCSGKPLVSFAEGTGSYFIVTAFGFLPTVRTKLWPISFALVLQDVIAFLPLFQVGATEIAVIIDLEAMCQRAVFARRTKYVSFPILYPRLSLFVMCLVRDAHCAFALLWSIIPIGAELSV